jgi:type I restriction enzyme S subunit
MLPKGWDILHIGDIAKVTSGGTPSREEPSFWNGDIPWIRTTEVQNCRVNLEDVKEFITAKGLKNSSTKTVPKDTILLAMIGQGKTRGQVAILTFEATINQNCAAIILNNNQSPEYYFYYLLGQYENIRKSSNSAGQSNLSGSLVKSIKVLVPPLPEQIKIAEILSTWDNAINTVQKLLANSQQQKKALMQQLLTGKKRFAGFEGEWEEKRLGDILCESKISSLTSSPTKRITIRLHLKGVEKRDFRGTESIDSTAHFVRRKGQFIYGKQNFHKGAFGIIPDSLDYFESSQDLPAFDFIGSNCPRWFYYYFAREEVYAEFENLMSGTGSKRLNPKVFLNEVLFVPSLPEQQKIAAVLTTADQEIDNLCVQLNLLKQEKKALMQQLLTGKRRVKIEEAA